MNVRSKRPAPVVSRQYMYAPDYCARVLALLLKEPVSKEKEAAGPWGGPGGLTNRTKAKGDSACESILPETP